MVYLSKRIYENGIQWNKKGGWAYTPIFLLEGTQQQKWNDPNIPSLFKILGYGVKFTNIVGKFWEAGNKTSWFAF